MAFLLHSLNLTKPHQCREHGFSLIQCSVYRTSHGGCYRYIREDEESLPFVRYLASKLYQFLSILSLRDYINFILAASSNSCTQLCQINLTINCQVTALKYSVALYYLVSATINIKCSAFFAKVLYNTPLLLALQSIQIKKPVFYLMK